MMVRMSLRVAAWFLATATTVGNACAHDVWITTEGPDEARRAVVNYGHPQDRPPVSADKIADLIAITAGGQVSLRQGLAASQSDGVTVVVSQPFGDSAHALLAARYDHGYWVKVAENDYRNVSRRLVPDAEDSLWLAKFAKAVTGVGTPFDKILGHDIELVPLSDPTAVRPGETLRVRVLFRGKPLADGDVERGDGITAMAEKDIPKFKTGVDGVAAIPITKSGPHLLVIDHRVAPSLTPDLAAADLYNATLWFVVR
jgi:nickel transport protein